MLPVWLVTGGSGFLGRWVLEELRLKNDCEIVAIGRRRPVGRPSERFATVDLADPAAIDAALTAIRPDVVIHAAGRTPPAPPQILYQANTLNTVNLLDALRRLGKATRLIVAGSAAELGPVPVEALPVGETAVCRPVDPYGLSKWLATCAALAARGPLEVISGRIFNPIGPGLSESQAFGRFARRLIEPETTTLQVGDLDTRRDFIDVRDAARALTALARQGRPGRVYHIGTGRSERVGDGLEQLIKRCGRSIEVVVDPSLKGSPGPRDSRADISAIVAETAWSPRVSFETSLDDLWNEALAARSRLTLTP